MNFREHILLYILVPALILSAGASYYRYVVAADYTVEYEGECDPETESCFEGCEDDECTQTYAYKIMTRHATELRDECGTDITECAAASTCPLIDPTCSIEYCDEANLGVDEACVVFEQLDEGDSDNPEASNPTSDDQSSDSL